MSVEKMRILQMIQEGKVTADEGMDLLKAVDESSRAKGVDLNKRFLRVRVASERGMKANVNVPLGLLKIAFKLCGMGMAFIPEEAQREMEKKGIDLDQIDFDELVAQIDQGSSDGKLVDVETEDEKEGLIKVEVYVD
ncbi:MAG: hypothetical protein GX980_08380 [Firmicutes bacterium]|mgnify:CR=1 FL=1|jgi:hypothetical protein|nr:hypothetical protein [Bacillota bacterium]